MNRKKFIRQSALTALGIGCIDIASGRSPQRNSGTVQLMVNAGVNGNTTTNLLKRVDTDCIAHKPDLVIMMVGTNDMANGKHVAVDKFTENLGLLADKIKASGSKLLLMNMLPFYEPYYLTRHPVEFFQPEGPEGKRKIMNEAIRKLAEKKNVFFFDISRPFELVGKIGLDKDSLLRNELNSGKTDGVHPTQNGYRFLGMAVSHFVRYHQLPTGRIVCFGDSITKGDGSIDGESYPAYLNKLLS